MVPSPDGVRMILKFFIIKLVELILHRKKNNTRKDNFFNMRSLIIRIGSRFPENNKFY